MMAKIKSPALAGSETSVLNLIESQFSDRIHSFLV
jgi:hypothetical protein